MKQFFCIAGAAAMLLLAVSCTQEIEERLSAVESKLESLQKQVDELNSQVGVIQQLLSGKYFVQNVSDLADGCGYKLVLVDAQGNTVEKTVLNGQEGHTPLISVRKDRDGNYYWTVDGEWMLVDGNKVRANGIDGADGTNGANGADGQTPEIKVEDGKWYYRLGGGQWIYAGEAVTTVYGPIQDVDTTTKPGIVIFILNDGTTIEVPFASALAVKLQIVVEDSAFKSLAADASAAAPYEVIVPSGCTYTLDSYEPEGWTVTFSTPKDNKGTLTIKRPAGSNPAKVLLIANASDGSSFAKVLHVGESAQPVDDTVYQTETVTSSGGSLTLPLGTVSVVIQEDAKSWISLQGYKLVIASNANYDSRTAVVTYKLNNKNYNLTITQAQLDAIVLTASSLTPSAGGETLPFVINANVTVSAKSSDDWLVVTPATKGLVQKVFTVTVAANESGTARSGSLTFTGGAVSQMVTVMQASKPVQDYVTQQNEIGVYLGSDQRVYNAGTDQYIRTYDGNSLVFVILNPSAKEQVVVSGIDTDAQVGQNLSVSIDWRQGTQSVLSKQYSMSVLKADGSRLWIGDGKGKGFILEK